jgi:uncharacterized glyoxalase superfamily protein PhnB
MKLKALTPILFVTNVNESVIFYQKYLDFEVVANVPEAGEWDFALLQSGGISIMIQAIKSAAELFDNQVVGSSTILYIDVENIAELYARMKGNVPIVQEMKETFYGTREFSVKDSDGYIVSFAEDQKA